MRIKIRLFGEFRKYGDEIDIEIPDGAIVKDLKSLLVEAIGDESQKLISSSRFATDKIMLDDDSEITDNLSELAIIPPVSGG